MLGFARHAASGIALLRGGHTASACHGEGLFEADLCNIGTHHVAGDVGTLLLCAAGAAMMRRSAHMPVKMAVMMVSDFRYRRVRSSKKADDYQPNLLHSF